MTSKNIEEKKQKFFEDMDKDYKKLQRRIKKSIEKIAMDYAVKECDKLKLKYLKKAEKIKIFK